MTIYQQPESHKARWTFSMVVQPPLNKDGTSRRDRNGLVMAKKYSTGMYPGGVAKAKKAIRLKEPWLVYHMPPNSKIPEISVYREGRFHGWIRSDDPDRLVKMN